MKKNPIRAEALNTVYKQLYELIGEDDMKSIYEEFKGIQITFPAHLYSGKAVKSIVQQSELSSAELAKQFGFSQKWIREAMKK